MYNVSQIYCCSTPERSYSRLESIAQPTMYQMNRCEGIDSLAYVPQMNYFQQGNNIAYAMAEQRSERTGIGSYGVDMAVSSAINQMMYSEKGNIKDIYGSNLNDYALKMTKESYHFVPDLFLKPGKEGMFVGEIEEVEPFVKEAFEKIFRMPFPNNIKLSVLNEEKFRKIVPNKSAIGVSINRNKEGLLSEIFVLNSTLGRVMLTIGHELGHVMTETLENAQDEEAKAYAFSMLWMKAIQRYNIGGLGDAVVIESPALNGLHDVAFAFVRKMIAQGQRVKDIYLGLVWKVLSVNCAS